MRYITVEIYKRGSVSPLNSLSSRIDRVALPCATGPLEEPEIAGIPVIKLVRRQVAGREYVHAEPEGDTDTRCMAAASSTLLTHASTKPPVSCTRSSSTIATNPLRSAQKPKNAYDRSGKPPAPSSRKLTKNYLRPATNKGERRCQPQILTSSNNGAGIMPGWLWLSAKPKQRPKQSNSLKSNTLNQYSTASTLSTKATPSNASIPDAAISWPVSGSLRPTTLTFAYFTTMTSLKKSKINSVPTTRPAMTPTVPMVTRILPKDTLPR